MEKCCLVCKKIFKVKPSHYNKRVCCSRECGNLNQKQKTGILNSNYKGGIKSFVCCFCKIEFKRDDYQKRKYCSTNCAQKATVGRKVILHKNTLKYIEQKKIDGKNNPKKKCACGSKKDVKANICSKCFYNSIKNTKKCIICNNDFKYKTIVKTCSRQCSKIHRQRITLSKNNPNWRGGIMTENKRERQSDNYIKWRTTVFIRDDYTCQHCGILGGCLHSHHIKSFSKHKDLRFSVENGLTLCKTCHKKIHNNMNFS